MPSATLSREEVVQRILGVFREYGYEGASLARLSAATGLGRSSLYHYFPNGKDDMAAAALAAVGAWFGEHVLSALNGTAAPRTRLKQFTARLGEYYQDGSKACLMDVFTIGAAGSLFQKLLRERLRLLIGALTKVMVDAGIARAEAARRAEDAVIALQGSLIVSRALGSTAPFQRIVKAFPEAMLHK